MKKLELQNSQNQVARRTEKLGAKTEKPGNAKLPKSVVKKNKLKNWAQKLKKLELQNSEKQSPKRTEKLGAKTDTLELQNWQNQFSKEPEKLGEKTGKPGTAELSISVFKKN